MEKQGKQGVIIFTLIFGLMWFSAKENSLTSPMGFWKSIHTAGADPGFPVGGGANPPGGFFFKKPHEIEKIWGGTPGAPPLDPPLHSEGKEKLNNRTRCYWVPISNCFVFHTPFINKYPIIKDRTRPNSRPTLFNPFPARGFVNSISSSTMCFSVTEELFDGIA